MASSKKQEPEPEAQRLTALPVYLTMEEICEAMQLSRETVRKFMHDPLHPLPCLHFGKNGKYLRFNAAKFAQWCEEEEQAQLEERRPSIPPYTRASTSTIKQNKKGGKE